jgi:hypothetical protein
MERHGPEDPAGPLSDRDPSDPGRRAVELAQRGRMILDVAAADLEAAEAALGAFHATTWFFRNALAEAQKSWDRLRAEFGPGALEHALKQPSLAVLTLRGGDEALLLIPIEGQTYLAEPVAGTPLAPVQWRLTRLHPPLKHGPYYACRLRDGTTQCDCAEWIYRAAEPTECHCKHLSALASLGWLDAAHRGAWGEP